MLPNKFSSRVQMDVTMYYNNSGHNSPLRARLCKTSAASCLLVHRQTEMIIPLV